MTFLLNVSGKSSEKLNVYELFLDFCSPGIIPANLKEFVMSLVIRKVGIEKTPICERTIRLHSRSNCKSYSIIDVLKQIYTVHIYLYIFSFVPQICYYFQAILFQLMLHLKAIM